MRLIFGRELLLDSYEYVVENYIPNVDNVLIDNENTKVKTITMLENSDILNNFKLKGIMLQAEVENRNGRKYLKHVIEREVKRFNETAIKFNSGVGTLGHDDTPTIKEDRVCHKILELTMDGNNAIGVAKITESLPMGRVLAGYVKEKIRFGMSSRGVGDIDGNIVGENYTLISIDAVLTPSAPQAYMESVIESKDYIVGKDGVYVEEAINTLKTNAGKLSNIYDQSEVAKQTMSYMMQFIESIANKNKK